MPFPGSFAIWQLAGSCAKQQGAFSFGASVTEPGTRFYLALFFHSAPTPTPTKCSVLLTSPSTLPYLHNIFLYLAFQVQDSSDGPPPRDQKVKLPTLTGVCSRAGDVIESSCPDKKRRMKRLNHLPHSQGNVPLTLRFGGQQTREPGGRYNRPGGRPVACR